MSLPAWTEALPDAAEMRATDRWAIDVCAIDSLALMEEAGAALAATVQATVPDGLVMVCCGVGNNGGDGFVAARILHAGGRPVEVMVVGDPTRATADACANLARLPVRPVAASEADFATASVIVDALLGTGATGTPRPAMAAVIARMNDAPAPIVSADIPSGVDASTGVVAGAAVRAETTVTFSAAKPGLWIAPGKGYAGRLEVADIGIPAGAPVHPVIGLLTAAAMGSLPVRGPASTKFCSGRVLVAGGCRGLSGAPTLAARGAMRAGAGYVTLVVPDTIELILELAVTEAMTRGLPSHDGAHTAAGVAFAVRAIGARAGALVLGPGLGGTDGAKAFALALAAQARVPLVLDADGLNAHDGALAALSGRSAATVLTPHAGELARLLGIDVAEVNGHRLASARQAAEASGAVVVLKGDDTLIVSPDGTCLVSPGGAPMLATAGTGDVLAGMIGALLAAGCEALHASAAAVWWHAQAGRHAAFEIGVEAVAAGDVVRAIGPARQATLSTTRSQR